MTQRMYAEGLPGSKPAEWFGPESRTGSGPGLGICPDCTHQTHAPGSRCGYRSTAPDGNGTVECQCDAPGRSWDD